MCWRAGTAGGVLEPAHPSSELSGDIFRSSASQFTWYHSLKLALESGFFFSQELAVKHSPAHLGVGQRGGSQRVSLRIDRNPVHIENPANKSRAGDVEPRNL